MPFPWIDPLSGGNLGFGFNHPDDKLPYYWGEAAPTATETSNHTGAKNIDYSDHPNNAANVTWTYETVLVDAINPLGKPSPSQFIPLSAFTWTFTENATAETISNLAFISVDTAALNRTLSKAYDFPSWVATPEPASILLFLSGVALYSAELQPSGLKRQR